MSSKIRITRSKIALVPPSGNLKRILHTQAFSFYIVYTHQDHKYSESIEIE